MAAGQPPSGPHPPPGNKPAKAYLVHRSPGRLRLRIPERRHNRSFFAELRKRLAECPSVNRADADPVTGSILAHFDERPGREAAILVEALEAGIGALIDVELSPPPPAHIAHRARHHFSRLNGAVRDYTGGGTDGTGLVILVLFLSSIWQIMQGQILAPAAQLLWYAMQISRATVHGVPTVPDAPIAPDARAPHHER